MTSVDREILFILKMKGLDKKNLADKFDISESAVNAELEQMFPSFIDETDAFLELLEQMALFRGQNVIVGQTDENVTVSNAFIAGDIAQVAYLKLALEVRLVRDARYRREQRDLYKEDKSSKGESPTH